MLKKKRKNRYKRRSAQKRRWPVVIGRRLAPIGKGLAVTVLIAAMSLVFIFGHDFLTQCDTFKARQVTVEGNRRLTADQVRHQAGIVPGVNVLALNLTLARKRLLAHPLIDTASVRRELPAAIVVRVSEHVPLAILDLGRKFIVNTRGEIFKEMADDDPGDLTVITGLTFSDIAVGAGPRSAPFDAVMAVFRLARDGNGRIPFETFRRIHVDRDMGLTLHAADRIKAVKIGFHDYRKKFRKLESILSYLNSRHRFSNVDAIDLNNLNRIVVTPAATQPPGSDHKEA